MASKNLVGVQLDALLLDRNISPEDFGESIGVCGMTVRRAMKGKPLSRDSKWRIARALKEDPSTFWPPKSRPRKYQAGTRKVAA